MSGKVLESIEQLNLIIDALQASFNNAQLSIECTEKFLQKERIKFIEKFFIIKQQKLYRIDAASKPKQESTERRDYLRKIEISIQEKWEKAKVFESNPEKGKPKFMCTFPYPYLNGYVHLGHAFSISKAEFRAGYERLKGKNVLFPFGFHCTGMPLAAAAKKIKREIEIYGNPPKFPNYNDDLKVSEIASHSHSKLNAKRSNKKYQWEIMKEFDLTDDDIAEFQDPLKFATYFPEFGKQHLKQFGLKVDWRRSFITTEANPYYNKFIEWQFLKLKKANKIEFGKRATIFDPIENQPCGDHDRSFGEGIESQQYTLIKMQIIQDFETPFCRKNGDKLAKLYESGKKIFMVAATLRPETMYGQTNCFVLPNGKYIAIETKQHEIYICSEHAARNMSWQGFTEQEGKYKVYCYMEGWDLLGRAVKAPNAIKYEQVFVLPLLTIKMDKGTGIVTSVPSDAPNDYIALKLAKTDKKFRDKHYLIDEMVNGFDVVPIIQICSTIKTKEANGERITRIEQFNSDQAAVDLCESDEFDVKSLDIKSKKDSEKLEKALAEIKDVVYKYGFSKGIMLVGDFKGEKVEIAKKKCQRQLIKKGLADIYWEPESTVKSRTGTKCVTAFCPQWFIKYGSTDPDDPDSKQSEWQQTVNEYIKDDLKCYNKELKHDFETAINWMGPRACSRKFGLGTKLPWDKKWVIEALSDSTIYMAYYTIAHYLQNNSLDGHCKSKDQKPINPEDLTPKVFDAIFCKADIDEIDLTKSTLDKNLIIKMREEFEYYYPMDLRVSGKDLIYNHLTMALYNHAAIWPQQSKERWPQSYFANGWIEFNGEKMSKSKGNFLTLTKCIEEYGADATRLSLASLGDTMKNADFKTKLTKCSEKPKNGKKPKNKSSQERQKEDIADRAILRLYKFEQFITKLYNLSINEQCRNGSYFEMDKLFDNAINKAINETDIAYKNMRFRDVVTFGFDVLQSSAEYYVAHIGHNGIHRQLIQRYIKTQLIIISPIIPHITESIWERMNKIPEINGFCVNSSWPKCASEDVIKTLQFESIKKIAHNFRNAHRKEKNSSSINGAIVCVADDYKPYHKSVLRILSEIYDEESNSLTVEKWKPYLLKSMANEQKDNDTNDDEKTNKKKKRLSNEEQEALKFAAYLKKEILPNRKKETFNQNLAYDEFEFLSRNKNLVFHHIDIDLDKVKFYRESDEFAPINLRRRTVVGNPTIQFSRF